MTPNSTTAGRRHHAGPAATAANLDSAAAESDLAQGIAAMSLDSDTLIALVPRLDNQALARLLARCNAAVLAHAGLPEPRGLDEIRTSGAALRVALRRRAGASLADLAAAGLTRAAGSQPADQTSDSTPGAQR